MKMKDEKQKHNHKLTDLIKICIFGLLMIAPLLASISQMLYVTLNKNAKDSYHGINYNSYFDDDNYNIKLDTYYLSKIKFNNLGNYLNTNNAILDFSNTYINYQDLQYDFNSINTSRILYENSNRFTLFAINRWNGQEEHYFYYSYTDLYRITNTLTWHLNSNVYDNIKTEILLDLNTINIDTLDNAFYYGVEQMTKSDLFNWTQNTAIYTGVKAMTDNLQIQTPAIAILIVYWFILTIIYVIIDIVLKCFTTITHMIFRAD